MKKERTYFAQVKLKNGKYVCIVFTSKYKKNTWNNTSDLLIKSEGKADIDIMYYTTKKYYRGKRYEVTDMYDHIYLMNDKNMDEQCFSDYEIIDLR